MRKPIIAGNWKMHCTLAEANDLADALVSSLDNPAYDHVDLVVCPPYTALSTVQAKLSGSRIALGGQNLFWRSRGAYTGQISPAMLTDVGCRYVIVGHSEARGRFGVPEPDFNPELLRHFGDSDAAVNRKVIAALAAGLTPICCVGETLAEQQAAWTDDVIKGQVCAALHEVTAAQAETVVFAYEPVWAIGTGEVCGSGDADRVCGVIRKSVAELYGEQTAGSVRIQYGGSVKPDNATELLSKTNIDGALVGGASLKAQDFTAIVAAVNDKR